MQLADACRSGSWTDAKCRNEERGTGWDSQWLENLLDLFQLVGLSSIEEITVYCVVEGSFVMVLY